MATKVSTEDDASSEPEDDVKMTIWEHLGELRKRIIRASIGTLLGAIVCWVYREQLLAWLVLPYEKQWKERFPNTPLEIQILSPADAFVNYMQLAVVGGVVVSAPIIFYQLWAFISPGLYAKEKRYIIPFVLSSSTLFGAGVAFAYYVAFPFTFSYFLSLLGGVGEGGTVLTSKPTMEFYIDITTRMLLAFGGVFELPILIGFLSMAGIVTPGQLVRFTRWAILLSFALGAIITPGPEISSQIAVSGALVVLYLLSMGLAVLVAPRRKAEDAKEKA